MTNINWDLYAGVREGSNAKRNKDSFIDFCQLVETKGHILLSSYSNNRTKVLIDFNCGHEPHTISPDAYRRNVGCPLCGNKLKNRKRVNRAKVEFLELLEENGHTLLSEYVSGSEKVCIDGNCGHKPFWKNPSDYKRGRGCPKCGRKRMALSLSKESKEQFPQLVVENGHTLLTEYVSNQTKVLIDFNCGHVPHRLTPNDYKTGIRCPACAGNSSFYAREEFILLVKKNGHTLLGEYVHNKSKVLIDFNCGHSPHKVSPNQYKRGRGCPKCSGCCSEQAGENLLQEIEKNGHVLLTKYVDAKTRVLVDFKCGHEPQLIIPNDYKSGRRCPRCKASRGENKIAEYLKAIDVPHTMQYSLTNKRRYDLYIPKYNLIVEVHGRQHYEEIPFFDVRSLAEEQENDRKKQAYAEAQGYNYMIVDYREHNPELALERFKEQFKQYQTA